MSISPSSHSADLVSRTTINPRDIARLPHRTTIGSLHPHILQLPPGTNDARSQSATSPNDARPMLSSHETTASQSNFARADADSILTAIFGRAPSSADAETMLKHMPHEFAERVFAARDVDQDDRLSAAESGLAPKQFERIDADGDGLIGRMELETFLRDQMARQLEQGHDTDSLLARWTQAFGLDQATDAAPAKKPTPGASPWSNMSSFTALGWKGLTLGPTALSPINAPGATADRPTHSAGAVNPGTPGADPTISSVAPADRYEVAVAALSDKLDQAGFEKFPPRNLHELIRGFGLGREGSMYLMKSMFAKYPEGMGVNRFA